MSKERGNFMTIGDMLDRLGIPADEETVRKLGVYHNFIMEKNQHINLTGVKDPAASLIKNVYDSLTVYDETYFPKGGRVLDLGTGAGFPGMILAILRPDMQFVLMDSIQKKLTCVEEGAAAAGVKNVKCLHMRAEEGGRRKKLRETFDVVTARAVKSLPVIAEWSLPFVKEGGIFAAMKGPGAEEELEAAGKILALMHAEGKETKTCTLPTGEERRILYFQKNGPAPKTFPRKVGIAEKNPILSESTDQK